MKQRVQIMGHCAFTLRGKSHILSSGLNNLPLNETLKFEKWWTSGSGSVSASPVRIKKLFVHYYSCSVLLCSYIFLQNLNQINNHFPAGFIFYGFHSNGRGWMLIRTCTVVFAVIIRIQFIIMIILGSHFWSFWCFNTETVKTEGVPILIPETLYFSIDNSLKRS